MVARVLWLAGVVAGQRGLEQEHSTAECRSADADAAAGAVIQAMQLRCCSSRLMGWQLLQLLQQARGCSYRWQVDIDIGGSAVY